MPSPFIPYTEIQAAAQKGEFETLHAWLVSGRAIIDTSRAAGVLVDLIRTDWPDSTARAECARALAAFVDLSRPIGVDIFAHLAQHEQDLCFRTLATVLPGVMVGRVLNDAMDKAQDRQDDSPDRLYWMLARVDPGVARSMALRWAVHKGYTCYLPDLLPHSDLHEAILASLHDTLTGKRNYVRVPKTRKVVSGNDPAHYLPARLVALLHVEEQAAFKAVPDLELRILHGKPHSLGAWLKRHGSQRTAATHLFFHALRNKRPEAARLLAPYSDLGALYGKALDIVVSHADKETTAWLLEYLPPTWGALRHAMNRESLDMLTLLRPHLDTTRQWQLLRDHGPRHEAMVDTLLRKATPSDWAAFMTALHRDPQLTEIRYQPDALLKALSASVPLGHLDDLHALVEDRGWESAALTSRLEHRLLGQTMEHRPLHMVPKPARRI